MRLVVSLFLFVGWLAAQLPESGSVGGKVVNAVTKEPLAKARVRLWRVGGSPPFAELTEGAGKFQFSGLEAGSYRLSVQRNGFVASADELVLTAGEKRTGLDLELTPNAVISGRVVDGNGEPMANVEVSALRVRFEDGRKLWVTAGSRATDDLGEYRIFNLPPGRYLIRAEVDEANEYESVRNRFANDETYLPSLYPGEVEARAGAEAAGIDFVLKKSSAAHIRGRVVNLLPQQGEIQVQLAGMQSGPISERTVMAPGPSNEFEFRGVTPGAYTLWVYGSATRIEVGKESIDDLALYLRPGAEVAGEIAMQPPGEFDYTKLRVRLVPVGGAGSPPIAIDPAAVDREGRFTVRPVAAGRYVVRVSGLAGSDYVKAVYDGPVDAAETGLDLTGEAVRPVRIVVSSKGARVTGTVTVTEGKRVEKAGVVLVPEKEERQGDARWYKRAPADASGHFAMEGIPPGVYRAYAWEDLENAAWMEPEFRRLGEGKSKRVALEESGSELLTLEALR